MAAGDVEMEFVAGSRFLVACCFSCSRHRTRWADRQESDRGSGWSAVRAGSARALAVARRPRSRGGAALSSGGGSSFLSFVSFLTGFSRASISVASRAITPTMRPPSVRAISAACILSGRSPHELRESAGKRGFRGHLRAPLPTEDATQRLVDGEALDQGVGSGNAQHRLGDEGPGKGAAILGRASGAAGRLRHKGFRSTVVTRRPSASVIGSLRRLPRAAKETENLGCGSSAPSWRRGARLSCPLLQISVNKLQQY